MARTAATVTRFYLEPHGLGARRGGGPRLAGGWRSFSELTLWGSGRESKPRKLASEAEPQDERRWRARRRRRPDFILNPMALVPGVAADRDWLAVGDLFLN